jgi:hypothetical protein
MQIGSSRDADEHYREAAAGEPRFQARDAFAKASFETAARFVSSPAQIDVH